MAIEENRTLCRWRKVKVKSQHIHGKNFQAYPEW